MKTLALEFTKQEFYHKQIKREGNVAIYQRNKVGMDRIHFEVVRIRFRKGKTVEFSSGRKTETVDREIYPPTEKWGTDGFTYTTADAAEKRFRSMVCIGDVST